MRTRLFCSITALLTLLSGLAAQPSPSSSFVLNVDYARFQNDQNSSYLEIYYGFYPQLITLQQKNSRFAGGVSLLMVLRNAKTGEVLRKEHSLLPVVVTDTSGKASRSTIITQAGYMLPFGDYRLHVVAIDSLAPSRRDSIELPISLKDFGTAPVMSDIELCSEIKSSEDKGNAFYKNSLEVVPNATLVFGVTGSPVLFHYLELYHLDPLKQYLLKTQIIDAAKKVVREATKPRKFGVKNAVDVGTVNVTSIASGKYRLVIFLVDESGQAVGATEKTFYVYNPHIQAASVSVAALKASELAGLSSDELAAEFRKAQYVATDEDIKTFAKLANEEGRREFLSNFWAEVEKVKPGKSAITRMDYLRRVAIASQRYGNQTREGWKTDRGRVYILYGDPDEIERISSQSNAKPHEIWHYYQIESGVLFVFVDRTGFGDYLLVHSTRRGELRDDTWQRFLQ